MAERMEEKLSRIWRELEEEHAGRGSSQRRVYRRVEIEKETGFRLGLMLPEGCWELLVEVGAPSEAVVSAFPQWRGMEFDLLVLDVPVSTEHVALRLMSIDHRHVFVAVCADLARALEDIDSSAGRRAAIDDFIERWSRFFARYGDAGLGDEGQRGLMGELWWLHGLLVKGFGCSRALAAWKGWERSYHDFDMAGWVVEVKTTISKEPRKVWISNERQLDESGLFALHLLVLTLIQAEAGGQTLPEVVATLRQALEKEAGCVRQFNQQLREAGYLDAHASQYKKSYTVNRVEIFRVGKGFPRITELPAGTGDLKYSLVVGACSAFAADVEEYLGALKGQS